MKLSIILILSHPYDTRLSDHMGGFATSTQCSEETTLMKSCKAYPLHDSIVLVPDEKDVCQFGYRLVHPLQTKEKKRNLWSHRSRSSTALINDVAPWLQPSGHLGLPLQRLFLEGPEVSWSVDWSTMDVILVKEKTNHPQFHHFYRLYKQFPNGWFIVGFSHNIVVLTAFDGRNV